MRIIDLTWAYLETVGGGKSLAEYERSFPALFEQYFLFWADRKLFSLSLTRKEVEERLRRMQSQLPFLEEKLKAFGFETENITLVLFVGQNTSNGHAFTHEGKWYVWLPLETYETNSQRAIFVTHEIIHAIQYMNRPEFFFETIQEKNTIGRELITEGLATYFTMKVLNCSLGEALWADYISPDEVGAWLSQCRSRESELCQFALRVWQADEITELFYANDPSDILKYRAGYYLGFRVMEEMVKRGLKTENDLLQLERKEFELLSQNILIALTDIAREFVVKEFSKK